ncbi:probable Co/Zn/Cd efflux system membrane fusion protein [Aquitalea magnusonii]|uniref:Probable Co/Zn/Cd efflux system membrane fusion protein n=1 Tax=Aquitalea magnusonii TaxID=332411 RepID=A0A3G9GPG8_9NEIS|nr:efflux RND transporter periplasmic adaptor subunit [Aquitalea magnusonii]BBF88069.1 probable Co/Zn/Cd efflux system membrane fusion protein [Aquitalea magnusonii]
MPTALRLACPLVLAMLLAACSHPDSSSEEIRPVRIVTAGQNGSTPRNSFAGQIRARTETDLAFRIGGKIVAKLVNSGEHVKKGQVLARLDPSDTSLDISAKQAQLAAAESDLAQQQLNLQRYQQLLAKQFISQSQVDGQQNGVNAARAKRDEARAQLAASRNQGSYTQLLADADGIISQINAEPGQVVAAGQAVARLAHDGEREAAIQVPENALQQVRQQKQFAVTLWAGKQQFEGSLRELAGDADSATRTYAARISLPHASALALGQTVTVTLEPGAAAAPQTLRLPLTAVLDEQGKHYVWVLNDKSLRVTRRAVSVLAIDSNSVTLQGGVRPGEKVVSAGVHLLHDNQRVTMLQGGQ